MLNILKVEQFQDTLSLYEECEYDLAYTFIYSPREGTPAAKMQDNVPFEQKQDRLERLNEVVKEKALKQNQRFLNQVVDVLVDGPFILEKKSLDCVFRGSTNQRIIDTKLSLKNKEVVLVDKYYTEKKVKNKRDRIYI